MFLIDRQSHPSAAQEDHNKNRARYAPHSLNDHIPTQAKSDGECE